MSTQIPQNVKYTADHEWLEVSGDTARVGITAFAADALGDIVYIELPAVGAAVVAGETCGEIESVKSVSDLFSPVTGEITRLNQAVADDPGLINADPFGEGWLFELSVSELPELLDAEAYAALIGGE